MPPTTRPTPPPPAPTSDPDPLAAWDFTLPEARIARFPEERRSASRLLHVPLSAPGLVDRTFSELPALLGPGDLIVANDTRVMSARLRARRTTGAKVEVFLLEPGPGPVRALLRPLKKVADGEVLHLPGGATARLVAKEGEGIVVLELDRDPLELMHEHGEMPLPPYLQREASPADHDRYQTVYARSAGAVAAPTAGLHFDAPVLSALAARGVGFATVTLHVGIGTFRPLRPEDLSRGSLHAEPYEISPVVAERVAATRAAGGRVVAVGTTTARALESATPDGARGPTAGRGSTTLFLKPPYRFRSIDGLITNFHLPRSSLLMLVASLIGRERLFEAYEHAIARGYRFYSYGDAMLLL